MPFDAKPDAPHDLALPQAGSTTARAVWSLAVRQLFEDLKVLEPPAQVDAKVRRAYGALRVAADAVGPLAMAEALRRPTVAAPLRHARDGGSGRVHAFIELAAQGLFELATQDDLPMDAELEVVPERLIGLSVGRAVPLHGVGRVRLGPGGLQLDGRAMTLADDPTFARGFYELEGPARMSLFDNAPCRPAPPSTGSESPEAVAEAFRRAQRAVRTLLPELHADAQRIVQQVVPVTSSSWSAPVPPVATAIGTLRLPAGAPHQATVESLLRGIAATKLEALRQMDPLLQNPRSSLPGGAAAIDVLRALHVCLPVARYCERVLETGGPCQEPEGRLTTIEVELARWLPALVAVARPTRVGRGVIDELGRWCAHFRRVRRALG